MSSANPEDNIDPEHNLTSAEVESRDRLEAIARHGLEAYRQVDGALAEIRDRHLYRDSHPSFETYARERWGVTDVTRSQSVIRADARAMPTANPESPTALRHKPCEALAKACDETLSALAGDDRIRIEIRLALHKQEDRGVPVVGNDLDRSDVAGLSSDELLPALRWLLAQASGTVGEVGHQLESRAAEVDDRARAQLRDDLLLLDGELAVVKALLAELVDWDAELTLLLEDELPPADTDTEPDDDPGQ